MATTRKRNVEIEFLVDDKRATKSLKNIEGQVTKTGKAFSLAGKLIASGIVVDKVVDFGRASIQAFTDLNESMNAVEVTFGGAAQGIKELGEGAAESLGLSNAEFNSLAVSFSAFVEEIARGSNTTVVPVMEDLTTRIADFASVMNIDVAEAAEKFRSGLAGETEPLRKFGIDLSAAAVNAKALELGLAGANDPLTEQEKILVRYELLMGQTNKTAGDFLNTSDELANSLRITNARFEDFKARAGEELAPALEKAVDAGTNLLDAFDEDVNLGWTQRLSAGLQTILGESEESVQAYIRQKEALNDLADAADDVEPYVPTEEQIELAAAADEKYRLMSEALAILEESSKGATSAQQDFIDQQKAQVDPAFKLLKAQEKVSDALEVYNRILIDGKPGSKEAEDAAIDLGLALLGLDEAAADLGATDGGIQSSVAAIQDLLEDAKIAPEIIQAIIDKILEFNTTPINTKNVFIPGVGTVKTGEGTASVGGDGTMIGFADGGMVPGPKGAPVPALVHGGEMILNPDQQAALKTAAPGTVITLNALSLSDRMLKEIQEMARRS